MSEQAMNSRNSDIIETLNFISHEFRCDNGFFGNRHIAGSRRHYCDQTLPIALTVAPKHDGAGSVRELRVSHHLLHCCELFFAGSRGQNIFAVLREPLENLRHLRWSFSQAENYLRHPGAQGPVMVYFRKAQILEGEVPEPLDSIIRREFARSHLLEKFANGFSVQRGHSTVSTQQSNTMVRLAFVGERDANVTHSRAGADVQIRIGI